MPDAAVPTLSAQQMLDAAVREAGSDDFGDDAFVAGYTRSIAAILHEVPLTPGGVAMLAELGTRMLVNHLRMQRDLRAYPEIREQPVAPPLVITGFPRTGTTKLQRVLSANPRVRSLLLWKLLNPAPFPHAVAGAPDPRIAWAEAVERMSREMYPEMWAVHPSPAQDADEDFLLHDMTFVSPTIAMRTGARRLLDALTPMDEGVYRYLRTVLQYLQWQESPGSAPDARPWVLKSPIHIGNLRTLQRVFPGARIVHCHRAVEVCMASAASLDVAARQLFVAHVEPQEAGAGVLSYWSREWERNIDERPLLEPGSWCDIRFDEINRDSIGIARRAFAFAGIPFDAGGEAAVRRWEAANPRHHGGLHAYEGAAFGVTPASVGAAFTRYLGHFAGTGILDAAAASH